MKKWEYTHLMIFDKKDQQTMIDMGLEGWEAYSVYHDNFNHFWYFFKREIL